MQITMTKEEYDALLAAERLRCAKTVCWACAGNEDWYRDTPEKVDDVWKHRDRTAPRIGNGTLCYAAAIWELE